MECLLLFFIGLVFGSGSVESLWSDDKIRYVGCYDPAYSLRQNYHHHIPFFTLEKCIRFCIGLRTRYAGVEGSDNFCYCGGDIAEESVKRDDSYCNIPCLNKTNLTCGGDWLMSVYIINGTIANISEKNENVGFLLGTSIGVRLYNSSNINAFDTIMTTADWVYTVDYHYAKNTVFVLSRRKLYKTTMEPKLTTAEAIPIMVGDLSNCDGFAVDWVHDQIYWAKCTNNTNAIMAIDLDGGNETNLMRRPEEYAMVKRMEVDPYKGIIFWTADGIIESCELSGDNFQTNVSVAGVNVRALTLDLMARRIYYVGSINKSSSLFSMDYDGEATREHFSLPQFKSVYGLGLLRGQLYWVNYANIKDVVYSAPLTTNHTGDVQMLKMIDRAVWHMKLLHPDLQKNPYKSSCELKGCSHTCVADSETSTRCQCPAGQTLDGDGIKCLSVHRSDKVVEIAMKISVFPLGILLIFLVVTVSGLLVYVGDRYWSDLQTKFFGVAYVRKTENNCDETSNNAYEAMDDNVNLI